MTSVSMSAFKGLSEGRYASDMQMVEICVCVCRQAVINVYTERTCFMNV